MKSYIKWAKEEDDIIRNFYPKGINYILENHLLPNRKFDTIRQRATHLKVKSDRGWTEEEELFLVKNINILSKRKISEELGRSLHSISKKYRLLKAEKSISQNNSIGSIIGNWTVLEKENKGSYYKCRCKCGKVKSIYFYNIRETRNCGCEPMRKADCHNFKGCGELYGKYWYSLKKNANKRNLSFDVTVQDGWDLFLKQGRACAITGQAIRFPSKYESGDGNASLDRIDSKKGYTLDNIQWVHKDINELKWDKTIEELIRICRMVVDFADRKKNIKF